MRQSELADHQDSGCIDHTDQETLRRLYCDDELTMAEIAEITNATEGSVAYYMRKHGIERRSKWHNNRTEKVPMRTRKDGYEQWDGNEKLLVHRLLAVSEFGFEAVSDCEVHHEDGVPWDNRPSNIELHDSKAHIREHSQFTPKDVKEMREMKQTGAFDREIADAFDTSRSTVNSIINHESWSDI